MIKFHARKPVRDFLNKVTEPPFNLPIEESNALFEAILEIYEETTKGERLYFLRTDTFDILRVFAEHWNAINPKDPKDPHRATAYETRMMLSGLIAATNQLGVRLSDSDLQRYEDVNFGICSFAQFVRDIYNPIEAKKPATSTGSTATDGSIQAAPAGISKQPQHLPPMEAADIMPDTPPESIFTDCIANDYRGNTAIIEKELKKALQGKKAKAAIIVFVTCFYHGILRKCPSHQQALYLSKSIGENHKGYNDQKEIYFTQSEEGKRGNGNYAIYDTLKTEKIDIIRESMITTEAKLKPLFGTLGIVITPDTSPSTNSLPPM